MIYLEMCPKIKFGIVEGLAQKRVFLDEIVGGEK